MHLKLALMAGALVLTALPASAQAGYYNGPGPREFCGSERRDNQAAGLILGGILGGVLGSNIAASGHRHDGTALGAVVGGVLGSEIGRGATDCRSARYGRGGPEYAAVPYPAAQYPAPPPLQVEPYASYDPQPDPYYDDYRDDRAVAGRHRGNYKRGYDNDDYAGRECADVEQVTRLPDGSIITRPVEACRTARYGDWRVRD